MLRDIPIDLTAIEARAVEVSPRLDNEGAPRIDPEGRAQYTVALAVTVTVAGRRTFEALHVTVPAQDDGSAPLVGVPAYSPVTMTGFRARPWSMEGRSGIALAAESITEAMPGAPSAAPYAPAPAATSTSPGAPASAATSSGSSAGARTTKEAS